MSDEREQEKNLGGRPRVDIDYDQLKKLCVIQCTGEECAAMLGLDYETLNRRLKQDGHGGFKEYFAQNSSGGKASLRRRQFQAAMEGQPTMLVWLGKQWLGQTDRQETTLQGPNEGPIQTSHSIEFVGVDADRDSKED